MHIPVASQEELQPGYLISHAFSSLPTFPKLVSCEIHRDRLGFGNSLLMAAISAAEQSEVKLRPPFGVPRLENGQSFMYALIGLRLSNELGYY